MNAADVLLRLDTVLVDAGLLPLGAASAAEQEHAALAEELGPEDAWHWARPQLMHAALAAGLPDGFIDDALDALAALPDDAARTARVLRVWRALRAAPAGALAGAAV